MQKRFKLVYKVSTLILKFNIRIFTSPEIQLEKKGTNKKNYTNNVQQIKLCRIQNSK